MEIRNKNIRNKAAIASSEILRKDRHDNDNGCSNYNNNIPRQDCSYSVCVNHINGTAMSESGI